MDLNLESKTVLITGASQGIGSAVADSFLKEGASVILVSRGSKKLLSLEKKFQDNYGKKNISAEICDCTSESSLEQLKDNLIAKGIKLDIVVANVGDGRSVSDSVPNNENWEESWAKNFNSALYTSRAFVPMLEEREGSLLFISSITGVEAIGAPINYSTAKSALIAFSKNLSKKLAGRVRVNAIAPGNINFPGSSWEEKIKADEKKVKEIINNVPMKRFGTPKEIANSAVFLSSDKASFITGALLIIDGGQTVSVL
jgi:3-oxoacyl-[acyl-carrier protein] reductase